jgi:hypothetical protein
MAWRGDPTEPVGYGKTKHRLALTELNPTDQFNTSMMNAGKWHGVATPPNRWATGSALFHINRALPIYHSRSSLHLN